MEREFCKRKKKSALRLLAWELLWVAAGSEEETSRGGDNGDNKPQVLVKMGNRVQGNTKCALLLRLGYASAMLAQRLLKALS